MSLGIATVTLTTPAVINDATYNFYVPLEDYNLGLSQGVASKSVVLYFWPSQAQFVSDLAANGNVLDQGWAQSKVPSQVVHLPTEYLHVAMGIPLPPGSNLVLPSPPAAWGPSLQNLLWILNTAPECSQYAGTVGIV